MQLAPVDLILHALAENLIGMEGNDESLRTLGHTILRTCVDSRALPAQWCNGAGVGQQMSWLTRRLRDSDIGPHVAAETRAMEVAIARRLADTGYSLLVTQDDGDKTTALTLLDAAHRVVGLPSAEDRAEDAASWESRIAALEGIRREDLDALRGLANEARKSTEFANLAEDYRQRLIAIKEALGVPCNASQGLAINTAIDLRDKARRVDTADTLVTKHEAMYAALRKEADEAKAEIKSAAISFLHMTNERDVITLQRDAAYAERYTTTGILKNLRDKLDAWTTWARQTLGVDDGNTKELQDLIAKNLERAKTLSQENLAHFDAYRRDIESHKDLLAKRDSTIAVLRKEADEAQAEALAHFKDVKTARDEVDVLRRKVGQLDAVIETNKRLQQTVQSLTRDEMDKPLAKRLTWIARFNSGNGGASITLDGRTVFVTGAMADGLAEALHPRRQQVADLKVKVEKWQALVVKHGDNVTAITSALKLDPGASQSDIIDTIKSLQDDRTKLCALACGDNNVTIPAPAATPVFKVGDRVVASSRHHTIGRYGTVIIAEVVSGMHRVGLDDGNEEWFAVGNLRPLPKVDP